MQGEVVPASQKDPEGWSATDKFTVVLETAGLNATELSAYCRERGLYPRDATQESLAAVCTLTGYIHQIPLVTTLSVYIPHCEDGKIMNGS